MDEGHDKAGGGLLGRHPSSSAEGKMVNQNAQRPVQEDDGLSEFNFFREDIVTSTMDPSRLCEAAAPCILPTPSSSLRERGFVASHLRTV